MRKLVVSESNIPNVGRKFLIEIVPVVDLEEGESLHYKDGYLDLQYPGRERAVISERKLDIFIDKGRLFGQPVARGENYKFKVLGTKTLSDADIKKRVYEEEINPEKQLDYWLRPENRDEITPYEGAQTRTIDEKKRALLLQAGFQSDAVEGTTSGPAGQPEHQFKISKDGRTIIKDGREYSITSLQADAIRMLYNAYMEGSHELHQDYILEEIGSQSKRLRDVFRSRPEVWGDLIEKSKSRGMYRLKL